jgi:hypothetical protein
MAWRESTKMKGINEQSGGTGRSKILYLEEAMNHRAAKLILPHAVASSFGVHPGPQKGVHQPVINTYVPCLS